VAVVSPGQVAAEMLCETVNVGDDQIHWVHSPTTASSPGQVAAEMLCETVNVGDDQIHWGHSPSCCITWPSGVDSGD
jgi:hypothetical protein